MGLSNANSFHSFVPGGKSHASIVDLSIDVPAGRRIQRRFDAPSDHSG